ncbi:MAG: hydroxyethylthiazole kinase [Anaerostipes sp.]|uniref:hydroxyethylthiazole kinase n=1 Tax=Anaerostipes sp. TaxID=1872530 RepID=UPI0039A18A38
MKRIDFERIFDNIRRNQTMVHCITIYVTINDVANMILAIGASPIMADDWMEVERSHQCVTVS